MKSLKNRPKTRKAYKRWEQAINDLKTCPIGQYTICQHRAWSARFHLRKSLKGESYTGKEISLVSVK